MVDNPGKFQPNDPRLIGNKFAVGADSGRKRTSTPSPEECIELGEELLKWATEETEEFRFRFAQWYSVKKHILRKDWKNLIKSPEFSPYYEEVQSIFADRCLDGTVKEGFGNRYLRLYDRDLIEEENEHAKFEAQLRKDTLRDTADFIVNVINYAKDKKIVTESETDNHPSI